MINEAAAEMPGATTCTCIAFAAAAVPAAALMVMAAVATVPRMLGLLVSTRNSKIKQWITHHRHHGQQ